MLNATMLSVVMLNAGMLSVIMLSVVAPETEYSFKIIKDLLKNQPRSKHRQLYTLVLTSKLYN